MSTKQFISAEEHLAKLDVTEQQALDFILTNIDQPEKIYSAAFNNGVTNAMLSEITNFSTTVIGNYFEIAGFDSNELDQTSMLLNSDLGSLESLVDFNSNSGNLSNTSLSETVRSSLDNQNLIDFFFLEIFSFQTIDGIYDAEELGVGHLENVPATEESLESIFYGSLINMFSELDESELNLINKPSQNRNSEEFQMLLLDALDVSSLKGVRSDEELAQLVTAEAAKIIEAFFTGESILVGVLDHSFLGLATA